MFCALNGATRVPRRAKSRQIAVAIQLLPTLEPVPPTKIARDILLLFSRNARSFRQIGLE